MFVIFVIFVILAIAAILLSERTIEKLRVHMAAVEKLLMLQ